MKNEELKKIEESLWPLHKYEEQVIDYLFMEGEKAGISKEDIEEYVEAEFFPY